MGTRAEKWKKVTKKQTNKKSDGYLDGLNELAEGAHNLLAQRRAKEGVQVDGVLNEVGDAAGKEHSLEEDRHPVGDHLL